jgi:hypothetical protein
MSVLIGCEYSGTVRDQYLARGHDAWSNDILPTVSNPAHHLQMDILAAIRSRPRWRQIILHIPCTGMAVSGNKHYGVGMPKHALRLYAVEWSCQVVQVALEHADMVAVENPASVLFPELRKRFGMPAFYFQPYEFGHAEQKKTGFAVHELPPLKGTLNVYDFMMMLPKNQRERMFHMPPSKDRGHLRSKFYHGPAAAMADQWGALL